MTIFTPFPKYPSNTPHRRPNFYPWQLFSKFGGYGVVLHHALNTWSHWQTLLTSKSIIIMRCLSQTHFCMISKTFPTVRCSHIKVLSRVAAGQIIPNIRGVAVIDVVEGSAMDALSSMQVSCLRGNCSWEDVCLRECLYINFLLTLCMKFLL